MNLHRATGLLDLSVIRTKKIVFLGLGSLGSMAVANLAYPWRSIVLVDPEVLEENNIERHLLGRSELGKPKVEGVRRWLVDRGISAQSVTMHQGYAEDVLDDHTDADLLVVAIDHRSARDDVNAWAVANGIPMVVGGIYSMGTGGHVMAIPAPQQACYRCAEHLMGADQYAGKPTADYGVDISQLTDDQGDLRAVPALRFAISALASDMVDVALEILTKGGDRASHVLVHAHSWEPVLVLRQGSALATVASFIASFPTLGLLPTMKLRKLGTGGYELLVHRGIFSLRLDRWDGCPLHASTVSANLI